MSIILCASIKGGVGKSTTAQGIAIKLAKAGVGTVIIDLDDETGSTMDWSAIRQSNGHEPSITVIQNSRNPVGTVLEMAKKFDAVIVDVGARDTGSIATFARICDLWVIPCGVTQKDLDATSKLLIGIKDQHALHPNGKIPMVAFFSRVPNRNTTELENAREYLRECFPDLLLLDETIKERRAYTEADELGLGVIEMTGRDVKKAVVETEKLVARLLKHMQSGE